MAFGRWVGGAAGDTAKSMEFDGFVWFWLVDREAGGIIIIAKTMKFNIIQLLRMASGGVLKGRRAPESWQNVWSYLDLNGLGKWVLGTGGGRNVAKSNGFVRFG